jgi:hypothetical protein
MARLPVPPWPDKTFIGRVDRGFDFLGCTFSPTSHHGLDVAEKMIDKKQAEMSESAKRRLPSIFGVPCSSFDF